MLCSCMAPHGPCTIFRIVYHVYWGCTFLMASRVLEAILHVPSAHDESKMHPDQTQEHKQHHVTRHRQLPVHSKLRHVLRRGILGRLETMSHIPPKHQPAFSAAGATVSTQKLLPDMKEVRTRYSSRLDPQNHPASSVACPFYSHQPSCHCAQLTKGRCKQHTSTINLARERERMDPRCATSISPL